MMSQGQQTVNNSASSTGGVNSGNTLKALTQYGQGLANQTYQQYLGNVQNLVGMGQNAATQTGTFGAANANQVGANTVAAGADIGAGTVAGGNALNSAIGGVGTNVQLALLLKQLQSGSAGGNGGLSSYGDPINLSSMPQTAGSGVPFGVSQAPNLTGIYG